MESSKTNSYRIIKAINVYSHWALAGLTVIWEVPKSDATLGGGWLQGLKTHIDFVSDYSLVFLVLVLVFIIVSWAALGILRDPKQIKFFQDCLDCNRDDFFKDEAIQGDDQHNHRLTLFYQGRVWFRRGYLGIGVCRDKWFFPWTKCLIPLVRSGHMTQKLKTIFLIHDHTTEGLAGKVWSSSSVLAKESLPSITTASGDADKSSYARDSFIDIHWVNKKLKQHRLPPRSLSGIPILRSDGKPWGVIMIDSTKPNSIVSQAENGDIYRILASHIAIMV